MDIQNIYNSIAELSREIVRECTARSVKISTAESCTGGMISGAVTSISGSSAVIELGVCSYSNRIKHEILHVPAEVLKQFTEYSVECAAEMAKGVMELSGADYGVSTTGVAGPTGGSAEHPVGEVCIAVSGRNGCRSERFLFAQGSADRELIRALAAEKALSMLLCEIKKSSGVNINGKLHRQA